MEVVIYFPVSFITDQKISSFRAGVVWTYLLRRAQVFVK